jgi:hypothetical protein
MVSSSSLTMSISWFGFGRYHLAEGTDFAEIELGCISDAAEKNRIMPSSYCKIEPAKR